MLLMEVVQTKCKHCNLNKTKQTGKNKYLGDLEHSALN